MRNGMTQGGLGLEHNAQKDVWIRNLTGLKHCLELYLSIRNYQTVDQELVKGITSPFTVMEKMSEMVSNVICFLS